MIPELLDARDFDSQERYDPPNPADNCFDEKPPMLEPDYYCRARGRWDDKHGPEFEGKWKYCYARAGAGTNHLGQGRCKHHGGAAPNVENRYAAMNNDTIAQKLAKFLLDPNPLDLRAELAAARALFEDMVERYDDYVAALIAWHASFDPKRRGLHDAPLYHIAAIQHAFAYLMEQGVEHPALDEIHAALEHGMEVARREWVEERQQSGKPYATDLKVEKPVKVLDISHAASLLKIVQNLATAIIKHEQEAFLSVFAVQALIEAYGEQTRKVLARHLRRLGVNDAEALDAILTDISRAWKSTPALEHSVPRLAAERRQQDEYLGS